MKTGQTVAFESRVDHVTFARVKARHAVAWVVKHALVDALSKILQQQKN